MANVTKNISYIKYIYDVEMILIIFHENNSEPVKKHNITLYK